MANSEVAAATLGSKPSSIIVVVSAVHPPTPPRPEMNPPVKELIDAITGLLTPKFNLLLAMLFFSFFKIRVLSFSKLCLLFLRKRIF